MRRMVPQVLCDHCSDDIPPDVRSAQANFTWPEDPPEAYAGELCKRCAGDLQDTVREVISRFLALEKKKRSHRAASKPARLTATVSDSTGINDASPQRTAPIEDLSCPLCPYVSSSGRTALGQHLKAQHRTGFKEQGMAKYPGRKPTTPVSIP